MWRGVPPVLGMLLAACSEGRSAEADRMAIDVLRVEHVTAVNTRNADLLLRGEATDLVYLAPDLPPILGRGALDSLVRPLYQQIVPRITMTPRDLMLDGDLAVEWGCLGGYIATPTGDTIPNEGKYVVTYRRSAAEGWLISHTIYNTGPCLDAEAIRHR